MRGPSPSTRAPARAPGRGPRIPLPGFTRRTWAWGSLLRVPVRVSALLSVSGRGVACPHLGLVGHVSCSQTGAGLRTDHRGGHPSPPPSGPTLSPGLVSAAADLAPGFSAEAPLLAPCTSSICSRYPSSYHPTRPELVPPSAAVPTTVGRSVGRSAAACVPGATPSLCSCWSGFQAPPEAPPAPPSTRRSVPEPFPGTWLRQPSREPESGEQLPGLRAAAHSHAPDFIGRRPGGQGPWSPGASNVQGVVPLQ